MNRLDYVSPRDNKKMFPWGIGSTQTAAVVFLNNKSATPWEKVEAMQANG